MMAQPDHGNGQADPCNAFANDVDLEVAKVCIDAIREVEPV